MLLLKFEQMGVLRKLYM